MNEIGYPRLVTKMLPALMGKASILVTSREDPIQGGNNMN